MDLRVNVLSSGELQLNGDPVSLQDLAAAFDRADPARDHVLYYRENPAGEPPPEAKRVMELVVARKLPIKLSANPFDGGVTIIRPDRRVLVLPRLSRSAHLDKLSASVPDLVPNDGAAHKIAVIADTEFTMRPDAGAPSLQEAGRHIPFFGLLIAWSYAGHNVTVFDGEPSTFESNLRESEFLILDSLKFPALQPGWMAVAQRCMNPPRKICRFNRGANTLQSLSPAPSRPDV